jgi:hypothetical protein
MIDWPELEDAQRRRMEEQHRDVSKYYQQILLEELSGKVDELFIMKERLARWDSILPRIQSLATEWGQPVWDLLDQVAHATWPSIEENRKGMDIQFKLMLPPGDPPELMWELRCTSLWYMGWFTVTLRINPSGSPRQFLIECGQPGYLLSAPVKMDGLKHALVRAYELGPVRDLKRKFSPGLPVMESE